MKLTYLRTPIVVPPTETQEDGMSLGCGTAAGATDIAGTGRSTGWRDSE